MAAAQEPGNVAVASVLDADYYGKDEYEPKYGHKGEYEPKGEYETKHPHSEYEKKDYGYGKASGVLQRCFAMYAADMLLLHVVCCHGLDSRVVLLRCLLSWHETLRAVAA
jgi:hypothetical protein